MQRPSGKYFVSVLCTEVEHPALEKTGLSTGVQLGLNTLVVTSDGIRFENQKHKEKMQKKIAGLQRQLSRKPSGSANREKARQKLAELNERIDNQRNDMLQKMTTQLVRSYDAICIRDDSVLNLRNARSAKVQAANAQWGEIIRQLSYKSSWYGKTLMLVERDFPSSQLCSSCGYKHGTVRRHLSEWVCPRCEAKHDKAINAAINIHTEGMKKLA
jgi:putative transposase